MNFKLTPTTQDGDGQIGLEMSLSRDSVMAGEPVVLRCRVTNDSAEVADTYMGMDLKDWLSLSLLDGAGEAVPAIPDPRIENSGGLHGDGARISPGRHYDGHRVLNRQFAITRPGRHRLSVRVHLPYAVGGEQRRVPSERYEEVLGSVTRAEQELAFTVTEPEPERLRAVAEELRKALFPPHNESWWLSLESLFSMPEEYALPSWQALVSDPQVMFIGSFVADELARISSLAAARLLAQIVWNPPPRSVEFKNYRASVIWQFHNMYFHSAPPVQAFIAETLAARGWEVPTAPVLITD